MSKTINQYGQRIRMDKIEAYKENEEIQKQEIEENYFCDKKNVKKSLTGLPCIISIQTRLNNKNYNSPRLQFQNNTSDKVTNTSDLITVSIEDNPKILIKTKYDNKLFEDVSKWIKLNKQPLLDYWNVEIDYIRFLEKINFVEE